jgi:hypothetical protein
MTKFKNTENISMYIVQAYCLTANTCRYVIACVTLDKYPIGTTRYLSELNWVSFQTRTIESKFKNVRTLEYSPSEEGPLTCKIYRTKITNEIAEYRCEKLPITVTLLTDNKKTIESYQQTGNVIIALETWATIVTFNN